MISLSDIKPLMIYLPDCKSWMEKHLERRKYFQDQGIENIKYVAGIHAQKWGLLGKHIYLRDGRPEEQFYIGDKKVGSYLSWYILFCMMDVMPDSHYWLIEDDCIFIEGWKEKLQQALQDVPDDFDFLFVGSCCTEGREQQHIKGDIWEVKYPQCGHCYIISKKCIPFLIETSRDPGEPIDVSLYYNSFPHLKVYTILPRLADQIDTNLAV